MEVKISQIEVEISEVERRISESVEVESHRQRPLLVRGVLGLPLGGKGFPGNMIGVIKE